jgi:hypothetical protein
MYLGWPRLDGAYRHDRQYMLGRNLLVAPVGSPGDPAEKTVWFPPGVWVDLFTGRRHRGPGTERLAVPLDRMPVFARAGAIVPSQGYAPHQPTRPPDPVVLTVWSGADTGFRLYEDAGDGLAYRRGASAFTRIAHDDRGADGAVIRIGAARGHFAGMRAHRRWQLRLVGVPRPARVTVDGAAASFAYDTATRTATLLTADLPTSRTVTIVVSPHAP